MSDESGGGVAALWQRRHAERSAEARAALVQHYAGLVRYAVVKTATPVPSSVDYDDLMQAGAVGLLDAIDKFMPTRGVKFETYALQRIRGAVLDELRAQDWVPRSVRSRARALAEATHTLHTRLQRTPTEAEIAAEMGESLSSLGKLRGQVHRSQLARLDELLDEVRDSEPVHRLMHDPDGASVDTDLLAADLRATLRRALEDMSQVEQRILLLSYVEEFTLREIGDELGVSEGRVCQVRTKALTKLRDHVRVAVDG